MFDSLPTPCCLLDKNLIRKNATRISERILSQSRISSSSLPENHHHGNNNNIINHRHHVKTLKSPQATRFALGLEENSAIKLPITKTNSSWKEENHLKSEKQIVIGSICCSTIAEIKMFAQDNFRDIFYAVGIEKSKIPHLMNIRKEYPDLVLTLITDSEEGIRSVHDAIESFLNKTRSGENTKEDEISTNNFEPFPILIEVNVGQHRGGVTAENSSDLLSLAKCILDLENDKSFIKLAGVLSHSGHSYSHPGECDRFAQLERDALVGASELIKKEFFLKNCITDDDNSQEINTNKNKLRAETFIVSAGSTPTASHVNASSLRGLTEVRSGVHLTFDLDQSRIGSCTDEDIAMTILTSVIGHQKGEATAENNKDKTRTAAIVIDAGGLALSKDLSAQSKGVPGYGLVLGEPNLFVAGVSQEHGLVKLIPNGYFCQEEKRWKVKEEEENNTNNNIQMIEDFFKKYPVGSRMRILIHHACFSAAPYDTLYAFDADDAEGNKIEEWKSATQWY